MKHLFIIVATSVIAGSVYAITPIVKGEPGNNDFHGEDKRNKILYLETVFDSVEVKEDIFFGEVINSEGNPEQLLLDVYLPQGDTKKNRPAILWIHGGGFRIGNAKKQKYIVRIAEEFARRGYVCFSVNYRVRTNPENDIRGTVNDAVSDAMSGVNWIRKNSKTYGISKKKIVIGGGSAGGMTAVNLCYKDAGPTEKWDKRGIKALVNLWGSPGPDRMFAQIDPSDPATIIVHGKDDDVVPFANSEKLVEELKQNRIRHELVPVEGAGHTPVNHMDSFVVNISRFLYQTLSKIHPTI